MPGFDLKSVVAIAILATGSSILGAFCERYGWPLFVVIPAYVAAGLPVALRASGVRLSRTVPTVVICFVAAMAVALYFVR